MFLFTIFAARTKSLRAYYYQSTLGLKTANLHQRTPPSICLQTSYTNEPLASLLFLRLESTGWRCFPAIVAPLGNLSRPMLPGCVKLVLGITCTLVEEVFELSFIQNFIEMQFPSNRSSTKDDLPSKGSSSQGCALLRHCSAYLDESHLSCAISQYRQYTYSMQGIL